MREILLHCIIQATNFYNLAWKGINTTMVNHATVNHVVHYATLQNTELTISIYQGTIQLAQINIKFFQECTYNTGKYILASFE